MKTNRLTHIALVAAGYCAVTLVIAPLSFGSIQLRVSEALTLLAINGWDDIWGLTLGCFMANVLGIIISADAIGPMDAVFGTCATFIAAVLTFHLAGRRLWGQPLLAALMPVVCNGLIVGLELAITLGGHDSFYAAWLIYGLQVAAGEAVVVFALGLPLSNYLGRRHLNHE